MRGKLTLYHLYQLYPWELLAEEGNGAYDYRLGVLLKVPP